MSSVCISKCMNDARDPRVPVRATYVNLYKWPESDAEFVRSVSSRSSSGGGGGAVRFGHPRVVDSISCRQMYLRSYKFSREEDTAVVPNDNTHKYCFGRSLSMLGHKKNNTNLDDHQYHHGSDKNKNKNKKNKKKKKKKRCLFLGKVRDVSRAAFFGIFRSCLSCTATVDVVDQGV